TKMEYAYAAADVVVARSGAMTIAELCVVGKPAVLVPYPFAAEDHQAENANALVKKQAAVMIRDEEVKEKLMGVLLALLNDEKLMNTMQTNISQMANNNADEVIASEMLKMVSK
ncbi:MAG: UDP-N-acetylglucosamine--N-acetylmuramyl-(pentapeptide) pyrophosphoryl-undecaprenol N-acetylglucosamine transferase, partial [Bacteroidota bacterium]|nr:UDP-N-acetylglucosamine--N-acetylmuramyl-(pentapeptide) pyrophosphoryl-undecaprenol N-acetylglucosamine transferase [Bacteroidota bacterium]